MFNNTAGALKAFYIFYTRVVGALLYNNVNILSESAACEKKLHPDAVLQGTFKTPKRTRVHKCSIAVLSKGNVTVTGELF